MKKNDFAAYWPNGWENKHVRVIHNYKKLEEVICSLRGLPYHKQQEYSDVIELYIDEMFFYVLCFTDRAFRNEEIKKDIFNRTELDFYKNSHIDEAGNKTVGIKTLWQLERFLRHYNNELKLLWNKMVSVQIENYEQLKPEILGNTLNDDVRAFKRYHLLNERNFLSDKLEKLAILEKEYFKDSDNAQIVKQETPIYNFELILKKVKFNKNNEVTNQFENCLKKLSTDDRFINSVNGIEVSTIAYIFYVTGWIRNELKFTDWLELFYQTYFFELTKYKPGRLENRIDKVKGKFPYMEHLPHRKY
ncbi:hypothetical protein [uncultured Draconibacterium sp.]|uniref:hypothetical protein n=1 Tax=uncultured Draconibacterium sp. TaxID=1573823 RepID=UPI0029C610EA|nr:hypothetical protein [uncultured Draconibacterium sp.]